MKKVLALLLLMCLIMAACGARSDVPSAPAEPPREEAAEPTAQPAAPTVQPTEQPTEQPAAQAEVRLGILAGPTGMGSAKLLQDAEEGKTANRYSYTLFSAPDQVTAKLIAGELDIAAVPTNLAAVLYQKTKGGVQLLALNTLGVLHLVTAEGESVASVEDLKGRTVYSSGQAAVPEYVLDYILDSYGLKDQVTVVYEAEHDAVIAALASGKAKIAVLPEPKVTAALAQVPGLSKALDLTAEWEKAAEKNGAGDSTLAMGCMVVRTDFARENKAAVDAFLPEYKASVEYMRDGANADGAAALCESFGIIPKAAVAKKALPGSNLFFAEGAEMKARITPFYEILFRFAPASVGGALPDDAFYYAG